MLLIDVQAIVVHKVAQWLALLPHSARDLGSIPGFGSLSVWSLHILPRVCVGFLRVLRFPPTLQKDVQVRWIGHAKLPLSVQRCVG